MRSLIISAMLAAALVSPQAKPGTPLRGEVVQLAATCFKSGERTSGMNKICSYQCLGGLKEETTSAISLCPLSIQDGTSSPLPANGVSIPPPARVVMPATPKLPAPPQS